MRIVDLFNGYFLALLVIQGIILDAFDSKKLKQGEKDEIGKKTKHVGKGIAFAGIILFLLRWFLR